MELAAQAYVALASPALQLFDKVNNASSSVTSALLSLVGGPSAQTTALPSKDKHPILFITGCSSGIGKHLAFHFWRMGYTVFATYRNERDRLDLLNEARIFEGDAELGRFIPVNMDVTDVRQIEAAVQNVRNLMMRTGEQMVGLVNNAGVFVMSPLEIASKYEILTPFEVNTYGPLAVTKAFLPLLKESKGRIINIGSMASYAPTPGTGPYNASKAALAAMTRCLRMELRQYGISVSLVEPGLIYTSAYRKALNALSESKDNRDVVGVSSTGHISKYEGEPKPESMPQYDQFKQRMLKIWTFARFMAFPTTHVSQAVEHSMTSSYPRERYLVGIDAYFLSWLDQAVPYKVLEAFSSKFFL